MHIYKAARTLYEDKNRLKTYSSTIFWCKHYIFKIFNGILIVSVHLHNRVWVYGVWRDCGGVVFAVFMYIHNRRSVWDAAAVLNTVTYITQYTYILSFPPFFIHTHGLALVGKLTLCLFSIYILYLHIYRYLWYIISTCEPICMPTEITYGEMNALHVIKHRDSHKAMSTLLSLLINEILYAAACICLHREIGNVFMPCTHAYYWPFCRLCDVYCIYTLCCAVRPKPHAFELA